MRKIDKIYKSQGLQGVLTLGYLFIVIIGVIGQSLYYSQLGINILAYSGISDILLSPISKFTQNIYVLITVLSIVFVFSIVSQSIDTEAKKQKVKSFLFKIKLSKDPNTSLYDLLIALVSTMLLGFYVGFDWLNGLSTSEKIEKGKLKFEDKIVFNGNDSTKASILGSNYGYVFFVTKDSKLVKVSPMSTIKHLEKKPLTFSQRKRKIKNN